MGLISKKCVDFVKSFEGYEPIVKNDMVGVPTLGYGMTGYEIRGLRYVSEPMASRMLEDLLNNKYALPIKNNLNSRGIQLKQNQFDAIVSMAYNIGVGGLLGSTLYANICKGSRDRNLITSNFRAWSKAGGNTVEGLLRRRTAEAQMFFSDGANNATTQNNGYCEKFQVFYNKVTQTSAALNLTGYGPKTQKALDTMDSLIKTNSRYCREFQIFYNEATQTKAKLSLNGYGPKTQKAMDKMQELVKA